MALDPVRPCKLQSAANFQLQNARIQRLQGPTDGAAVALHQWHARPGAESRARIKEASARFGNAALPSLCAAKHPGPRCSTNAVTSKCDLLDHNCQRVAQSQHLGFDVDEIRVVLWVGLIPQVHHPCHSICSQAYQWGHVTITMPAVHVVVTLFTCAALRLRGGRVHHRRHADAWVLCRTKVQPRPRSGLRSRRHFSVAMKIHPSMTHRGGCASSNMPEKCTSCVCAAMLLSTEIAAGGSNARLSFTCM